MDFRAYKATAIGSFTLWLCSDRGKIELVCYVRGAIFSMVFYLAKLIFMPLDLSALTDRQRIGLMMIMLFVLAGCWVYFERRGAKARERIESGAERCEEDIFDALKAEDLLAPGAALLDAATGKKGRPVGSGGFADRDAPIVDKMREMITADPAVTVFGAAGFFADEAAGSASFERKQRRLADRYKKTFPT